MNGKRILTFVVALCCISAAGITATTFESTLETEPDKVIDFEYSLIPIGKDDVRNTKREAYMNKQGGQSSGGGGGGSSGGSGNVELPPTCSGSFLVGSFANLLPFADPCTSLFYLFGLVLPFLLLLFLLGMAYRYRGRMFAPGLAVASWLLEWARARGSGRSANWPREPPANDIHHAWLSMVERTDIDRPWTRTPTECARAAVDAGLDSEAVNTLTALFEEVRYGGAPSDDERRRQAREWRKRLEDRTDRPPTNPQIPND